MSMGKVSPDHEDVKQDPEGLIAMIGVSNIFHDIPMKSCYHEVFGKEPDFTNYTDHYTGCLDYIWFTSHILPLEASNLPTTEDILSFGNLRLPNPKYVSDHLALDCTLAFN